MNKKSVLWILLDLIFLIVFNTVFFVAGGTDRSASVWISYGFIHFSYLMVLVTPFLIRKSSSAAVFGFSLYSISSTYFLAEFVIGLIFILLNSDSYKVALVVQVILAGIYAVLLLSHLIANEATADSLERHEAETAYIKTAASRVKLIMGKATDKKANKEVERTYDMLHSSPSKTIPEVHSLEIQVKNKITMLEEAVRSDDTKQIIALCWEIVSIMEERNSKIRLAQK